MGNFEADANYQQSLRFRLAKLGPDHPAVADTLTNLGTFTATSASTPGAFVLRTEFEDLSG